MKEGLLRGLYKQPLKVIPKRTFFFFNVLSKGGDISIEMKEESSKVTI